MRKFLFSILFTSFLLIEKKSFSQVAFKLTQAEDISVNLKFNQRIFSKSDDVTFTISIHNTSKYIQRILFDKLDKKYPWGVDIILRRSNGEKIKLTTWAFLSSTVYSENQLTDFYTQLLPKGFTSHTYYLNQIVRVETEDLKLPKGKYSIQISFDNILSNIEDFEIK
ncbi:MAG: hypothetical protein C0459_02295 [Chitinophaga sp.]|jgi:hypothetical protein|nr:hypothetical protein [Chitinophaga sp.]